MKVLRATETFKRRLGRRYLLFRPDRKQLLPLEERLLAEFADNRPLVALCASSQQSIMILEGAGESCIVWDQCFLDHLHDYFRVVICSDSYTPGPTINRLNALYLSVLETHLGAYSDGRLSNLRSARTAQNPDVPEQALPALTDRQADDALRFCRLYRLFILAHELAHTFFDRELLNALRSSFQTSVQRESFAEIVTIFIGSFNRLPPQLFLECHQALSNLDLEPRGALINLLKNEELVEEMFADYWAAKVVMAMLAAEVDRVSFTLADLESWRQRFAAAISNEVGFKALATALQEMVISINAGSLFSTNVQWLSEPDPMTQMQTAFRGIGDGSFSQQQIDVRYRRSLTDKLRHIWRSALLLRLVSSAFAPVADDSSIQAAFEPARQFLAGLVEPDLFKLAIMANGAASQSASVAHPPPRLSTDEGIIFI